MAKDKVAFAFTILSGPNAGLTCGGWRVWTHAEDTFITTKDLGGVWKASLHGEVAWRVALTKEHATSAESVLPRKHDRAVWKFAPTPFINGRRLAFAIGVTRGALLPMSLSAKELHIPVEDRWDALTVAYVWMTEPGVRLNEENHQLVGGPLRLESGRQVWVSADMEPWKGPPESKPVSAALVVLTPEKNAVRAPGFLLRGVYLREHSDGEQE